ncbi:putative protein [Pseudoclavibacter triregionum]|nr:putative protein [Pseudoclavibacter triregionum]
MLVRMLLAIDTSAGCEAAVVDADGRVLAAWRRDDARGHAEAIGIAIRACLEEAGLEPSAIREVVAGIGPGPFTGLRVGVAAARAFALAIGVPCTAIPSHDAIAREHRAAHPEHDVPILVLTDARRRQLAASRYVPGSPAAAEAPVLVAAAEADALLAPGETRVDASRVDAAQLALALLDRRAAGIPDATGELLYLRVPDAIPSAGPKRVSA